MILLKHKPLLLDHFENNNLYCINNKISRYTGYISTANKKFGNYGMCCNNRNYNGNQYVVQVDNWNEMHVSLWCYSDTTDIKNTINKLGYDNLIIVGDQYQDFVCMYIDKTYNYYHIYHMRYDKLSSVYDSKYAIHDTPLPQGIIYNLGNQWIHIEYDKTSTGLVYFFINGRLIVTINDPQYIKNTIQSPIVSFNLNFPYIDELLVTNHCLHTASFTPFNSIYYWSDGRKMYDDNSEQYTMDKGTDESIII